MNPAGTQLGTRVAFSFETLAHDARSRERHAAARGKHRREDLESTAVSSRKRFLRENEKRENEKTRAANP